MTIDTVPELIAAIAGVGSASLAFGALIVGPIVYRWRLRRTYARMERDYQTAYAAMHDRPSVPELADLLAQVDARPARDPDPLYPWQVRTISGREPLERLGRP